MISLCNLFSDVEGKSYISYKRKDEGRRPNIVSSSTQVSGKRNAQNQMSLRTLLKTTLILFQH